MPTFPDPRETRSTAEREADLLSLLSKQIAHAKNATTAFAKSLENVDPVTVTTRATLAKLPVIRKNELREQQQASRAAKGDPFGGYSALGFAGWNVHAGKAARVRDQKDV